MTITIAQWKPEYATGDPIVDEQHQSIFSIINALNNAMLEGQGENLIEDTIESLKEYTAIHFDTEEEYMLAHNYPGYEQHKKKHEALKARVESLHLENKDNLSQLTIIVSRLLNNWLIEHILGEDKKMILYCTQGLMIEENWAEKAPKTSQVEIAHWMPDYETGFVLIDNQHKSLFHAINALNNAMLAGRGVELLDRTLRILHKYTTIHFETEELYMRDYNYSGYEDHKHKHEALRKKVVQFEEAKKTENASQLTINVSRFLTQWLIDHINNEDKKMIYFLREKRAQEKKYSDSKSELNR